MSSSQQSNNALSVAEASLRKALARIKRHQADGRVSVNQAHAIALQVSCKKRKLVKSKPVITVSDDEDDQPTGTIVVKQSKPVVPQTPAPAKKAKQTDTEGRIGRPTPKGKGKEKDEDVVEMAVEIPAGNVFNPPCKKCDGGPCLIALGRRGQPMKSCVRCNTMKVKCKRPEEPQHQPSRATSRVCQPTPIVESEDAGDDTVVPIAEDDIVMSDAAGTDQQTDVAAPRHTGDHPATIASVNDFPPDHWLEESDAITIPPPPPTAEPTTSAVEA
ncbi:hypothetical protein P692DRAFT_201812044 [Suillus brevipes Sb2]|nr:hypothetical protein P692DRAFT_201812044 [Suillus brevipes Sb2]